MKKFIKNLLTLSITAIILGLSYSPVYWITGGFEDTPEFPYNNPDTVVDDHECDNLWDCTNLWDNVYVKDSNSIINRLLEVFGLNSDTFLWDHKFISYAKAILNLALGLLSLIALVMTIYTFYMMFFTDNEAWIKKAKWNLVGIFIALAIIGLSWIIVSFIFRWYQSNRQTSI